MVLTVSILSQFNAKVNLAKVVEDLGFENCLIQKISPFGQFVSTIDNSFVGNIFDLFSVDGKLLSAGDVYQEITTNKTHYLNEPVTYSDYKKKRIQTEDDINKVWTQIVIDCQNELKEHTYVLQKGNHTTIEKLLIDQGYAAAILNGFGHISPDIVKKYSNFNWNVLNHFNKPILVPFYYTPKHLSYIKIFDLLSINDKKINMTTIYQHEFNGWSGQIGKIVPSQEALTFMEGSVWNYTQDFWTNKEVELSFDCSVELCLEIWKQSSRTKFKQTPLSLIKEKKLEDKVHPHTRSMSKEQVMFLADYFELKDLYNYWVKLKETEYTNSGTTYYKRNEGYFMNRKGIEYQLTNFTLTIKSRFKKNSKTYYNVEANQGDKSCLFELDTAYFDNFNRLKNYIRETLVDNELEQPRFMNPEAERRLNNFLFDYFR